MKHSIRSLALTDHHYPHYLRAISKPPKQLYYIGDLMPLLSMPRLAVVGSRKVSPYGRATTSELAGAAANRGIVIISGLALGVDSLAHQAAIDVGGKTIAVLASGLDRISPTTNRQLAIEILRLGGAIVSEYAEGVPPYKMSFVERNRLVSGMSDAVLITEAAEKSGTLHTANFALEQGRDVLAVPGNITSQLSKGTNNLIKAGATPVTELADILTVFSLESEQQELQLAASPEEATILDLLRTGISDGSELLLHSKLPAALFNQTLTMLEITGKIRPLGAGHWAVK